MARPWGCGAGLAGLSLKYADRPSSAESHAGALPRREEEGSFLLARAMATLYRGEGARNCPRIRPLALDCSSRFISGEFSIRATDPRFSRRGDDGSGSPRIDSPASERPEEIFRKRN